MKNYNYEGHKYLVSVYMTTYFHEKYVAQAIDSILSQCVNFQYEIVISDDASNDGTIKILKEYENKYSFIHLNLNEKNIGLTNNMYLAKTLCSGKYIVPLSGDDYWIDNNKLQKQVDFLERHKRYIGVATRIEARTGNSTQRDFTVPKLKDTNKSFSLKDYLRGYNLPLNGMMMKNVIQEKKELFSIMPRVSRYIDDTTDCLLILSLGKVFIMKDVTVAYRRRIMTKGEHNFNSINPNIRQFEKGVELLNGLHCVLSGKYDLFHRYKRYVSTAFIKSIYQCQLKQFFSIYRSIPDFYRRRFLLLRSILFLPSKFSDYLSRKLQRYNRIQ